MIDIYQQLPQEQIKLQLPSPRCVHSPLVVRNQDKNKNRNFPLFQMLQSNKMQITKVNDLNDISIQDESLFNLENSQNEKMRLKHSPVERKRTYQWTDEQNKKYYSFLRTLKQMNAIEYKRVKIRYINIKMSAYIKTRTSNQCRSHHQKMLCRFGDYEKIISHFQTYFLRKDCIIEHNECSDESQELTPSIKNSYVQVLESQNNIVNWPITAWDLEYVLRGSKGIEITQQ